MDKFIVNLSLIGWKEMKQFFPLGFSAKDPFVVDNIYIFYVKTTNYN